MASCLRSSGCNGQRPYTVVQGIRSTKCTLCTGNGCMDSNPTTLNGQLLEIFRLQRQESIHWQRYFSPRHAKRPLRIWVFLLFLTCYSRAILKYPWF
ncbi:hypothetical protein TNIN_232581 [Trichonephila inaurata madagascariensis]|uniref:Uncharacterized protein n=1 Tax=Trichonephila inaurata madagascariensis TaxID=2747483 RepID=A0A8X6WLD9_9ARAC|nr:hypothetical protein TNIN_232581 [Trichonephila inaurata madagascariensis]